MAIDGRWISARSKLHGHKPTRAAFPPYSIVLERILSAMRPGPLPTEHHAISSRLKAGAYRRFVS